jgi:hypothetical protein
MVRNFNTPSNGNRFVAVNRPNEEVAVKADFSRDRGRTQPI